FKEPTTRGRDQSRFLGPPPDIEFRMAAGVDIDPGTPERTVNMVGVRDLPTRKFGAALTEQNAILISGCRSDQTSAGPSAGSIAMPPRRSSTVRPRSSRVMLRPLCHVRFNTFSSPQINSSAT
ncbi:MAG TPA: hypothetical protein PKE20_12225, partial [Promineifilum sp.]|nr:hypothetical protein [Promineifilum sp.]